MPSIRIIITRWNIICNTDKLLLNNFLLISTSSGWLARTGRPTPVKLCANPDYLVLITDLLSGFGHYHCSGVPGSRLLGVSIVTYEYRIHCDTVSSGVGSITMSHTLHHIDRLTILFGAIYQRPLSIPSNPCKLLSYRPSSDRDFSIPFWSATTTVAWFVILSSIWGLGKLVRGENLTNKLQIICKTTTKKTGFELIAGLQRFDNFIHKTLTDSLYIPEVQ